MIILLNNCLFCNCHKDNKKSKCTARHHKFNVTQKLVDKLNKDIAYIKKEVADDRHIFASLGSAGYTFSEDINRLANYAYSIGDKEFYELVNKSI